MVTCNVCLPSSLMPMTHRKTYFRDPTKFKKTRLGRTNNSRDISFVLLAQTARALARSRPPRPLGGHYAGFQSGEFPPHHQCKPPSSQLFCCTSNWHQEKSSWLRGTKGPDDSTLVMSVPRNCWGSPTFFKEVAYACQQMEIGGEPVRAGVIVRLKETYIASASMFPVGCGYVNVLANGHSHVVILFSLDNGNIEPLIA